MQLGQEHCSTRQSGKGCVSSLFPSSWLCLYLPQLWPQSLPLMLFHRNNKTFLGHRGGYRKEMCFSEHIRKCKLTKTYVWAAWSNKQGRVPIHSSDWSFAIRPTQILSNLFSLHVLLTQTVKKNPQSAAAHYGVSSCRVLYISTGKYSLSWIQTKQSKIRK